MKQWKTCFIFVLTLVLLSGCGITPSVETSPTETSDVPETTESTPTTAPTEATELYIPQEPLEVNCQYLPKEVDNPDNLPVLKWVCLTERRTSSTIDTWSEDAVHEFNKMLVDRDMPFRIQFVVLTMNLSVAYVDWFTVPEAQEALVGADLIYAPMTAEQMQHYLTPITDYVSGTAEPSLANAVPHVYNWYTATIADHVYGIPTSVSMPTAGGWLVDPDFLKECGLTEEDMTRNFWEMDEVFEIMYEKNGNEGFLLANRDSYGETETSLISQPRSCHPGVLNRVISYTHMGVGSCFTIDYSAENPTLVISVQTQTAKKIKEAYSHYKDAGYIVEKSEKSKLEYGNAKGTQPHVDENGDYWIPVTPAAFRSTQPSGFVSGVAAETQHKTEALTLLNLITEDKEMQMQLFYGKEGRDYTVNNGYYEITEQADGSYYGMSFLSPLSKFCGLTADSNGNSGSKNPGAKNQSLYSYEGKTKLETYRELLDSSQLGYPIIFDYTGFDEEITAIRGVIQRYSVKKEAKDTDRFNFSELTEAQYDQMLFELEAAGAGKILTELEKQLALWKAEHPNWGK